MKVVNSVPIPTSHKEPSSHRAGPPSAGHLAAMLSITLSIVVLYTIKLCFLRARTQPPQGFLLNSPMSVGKLSGSPFLLGFLGSPARELDFVATDLLRLRPSGRIFKRQHTQYSIEGAMAMLLRWIKEPSPPQPISRFDTSPVSWGTYKRDARATVPPARPATCADLGKGLSEVATRERGLPAPFDRPAARCAADVDSLAPRTENLPLPCEDNIDRRQPTSAFDRPDVMKVSNFSASLVANEGYSPWLASLASLQLGPSPGHSFLENLESSSPMPLTFRLPYPLLPAKAKVGPSKRRSPLRSILLPQSKSAEEICEASSKGCSDDLPIPLFSDPSSIDKGKTASYRELGLGRPPQRHGPRQTGSTEPTDSPPSPVSSQQTEADRKSTGDSPTLELMLEQLVQVTSDWDDSIYIDERFKDLLCSTKRSETMLDAENPPTGETLRDACNDPPPEVQSVEFAALQGLDSDDDPCPDTFLASSHALRDRTRDLLFSIPEDDAISFTDIVIQTY